MYRQVDSTLNNKGAADENSDEVKGKKTIGNLLGPRRNVLADMSNAGNPNIFQKTTLLPKRNLRPTTIQATLATKSKILGVSNSISSGVASGGRPSIKPGAEKPSALSRSASSIDGKENIAPGMGGKGSFPPVKRSFKDVDYEWDDLDAEDEGDTLMVADYAPEIFEYMFSLEKNIMPGLGFIQLQKELNWHMRAVLVDWLIEVQWKSKLLPETLFLSINIIDRFLARRAVSLVKLQLVGLAGSLLASKFEEIMSPSISNFVFFSDNAYTEQELLKAERYMLHVMDFNLAYPNPLVYLRRISKADDYDLKHRTLAKFLIELTLLDHRFIVCPPSMIAAIGMWLSRTMLRGGLWSNNLIHYSGGYTESDLKPWADTLIDFLKNDAYKYEAIFKKYSSKKLMKASIFVQDYMKKYHGVTPTLQENTSS